MFNHKRGRGGCAEGEAFECSEVGGMRGRHGHRGGRVRGGFGGGCGGFDEEFATGRGMGPGRAMGRGGGRGPGMRGGRRKRLFDQAELQALLLALIVDAPSPGVVYPALTYMEESGLIAVMADESSRKSYEATEEGRQQAEVDAEKAALLKARLAALAEQRDRVDPAPVRRAMQALKTAMFDRLNQEGADRELTLQIADAIDEATRKIERIES